MRILLVRLSSFGDVVFTLPLARALKESYSGAELAWAVEGPLASLLEGSRWVDRVLVATTREWRRSPFSRATLLEAAAFVSALREFAPDLVVDPQGLFKSAWVTALAGGARRVGLSLFTAPEWVNTLATDEHVTTSTPHVADRALALAGYLTARSGFERLPDVSHLTRRPDSVVDAWLAARGTKPFVLVQPFASARDKEWEGGSLLAFARRLAAAGAPPVFVRWGPGEEERAAALAVRSDGLVGVAPPAGPAASARLAASASLFVGADTGPTHLAAAAGVPTIALFGPTDPARFGSLGPRAEVAPLPLPYDARTLRDGVDGVDPLARRALSLLDPESPR